MQLTVPHDAVLALNSQLATGLQGYALTIAAFGVIVRKQREVKSRLREWKLRKRVVWHKVRARAAKRLQRASRIWLSSYRLECPSTRCDARTICPVARVGHERSGPPHAVCYDDFPWFETKKLCKLAKSQGGGTAHRGGHRLCGPCAATYVDMALGEGKLYGCA